MTSVYLAEQFFDLYKGTYASLHYDDPGLEGTTEINVQRQPLLLNSQGVTARDLLFQPLPAVDGRGYGYVGIWSASKGGRFVLGIPLVDDKGAPTRRISNQGDVFVIPAGGLRLKLQEQTH